MSDGPVIIERKDPRFDTLRKGFNLRFPANESEEASRVILCKDAAETAEALRRVVASGMRPTVRSGGHCYEDFVANNPNGAILDLSLHNKVDAAPSGSPLRIAPGAKLGEVYQTLYKRYGVTIPAGTCYMVGAGGHISGGGYGLASRLRGLTVDWVTAIDILTVDGSGKVIERKIDKLHDSELFRACRGVGGGNFGIITNFYFERLPPAPREVAQASLSFPWSSMTEEKFSRLLMLYGDYWAGRGQERDSWGLSVVLVISPAGRPNSRIVMDAEVSNADGTATDLSVLHEFFKYFAEVAPDQAIDGGSTPYRTTRRPWLDATLAGSDTGGPVRGKYKSTYMKKTFTAAECHTLYKYLTGPVEESQGFVLAIDGYGGATNAQERVHDTAIAQRSSIMKLQWQCYWQDKDRDAGRVKFMDDFYTAMYTGPDVPSQYQGTPFGERYEGCYMNYADADMIRYSHWPQLFYGTAGLYPMLQRVKKRYDPNNIFHSSMSVRT
jgi:FAD/FMN-containing dehydrogenase